jgi:hypothetical protein
MYLEGKKYVPAKVPEWVDAVNNELIEELKKISANFKYVRPDNRWPDTLRAEAVT